NSLGGHAREQLDQIEREKAGRVIEHARMVGQPRGEDSLVTDRRVREDQDNLGVAQREVGQAIGDRRHPASRVDQDRYLRFFGEREDAVHLRAIERKCLGAWMQLDPARALRDATLTLCHGCFRRIEPAEGDQTFFAFAGPPEDAVVGDAVGGLALGVMQGKHARPARSRSVQLGEQCLQVERAAVLVEPEMGVGVEHLAVLWSQPVSFREERSQCVGIQGSAHGPILTIAPTWRRLAPESKAMDRHKSLVASAYPELTMAILDEVKLDLNSAMRAGEKQRVGALRMILSELQKASKEGSEDELAVLRRERKRRLEAARAFREGGREDLAAGEEAEGDLIRGYLPAELSEQELQAIVERALEDSGAQSPKDMGMAMKSAMAAVDGRADGKRVSGLVKAALGG